MLAIFKNLFLLITFSFFIFSVKSLPLDKKAWEKYVIEITVRNFMINHSVGPVESNNWWTDYSSITVFNTETKKLEYFGVADGCLMGIKCCTNDGEYCYTDNRYYENVIAYYANGNVKLLHNNAYESKDGEGSFGSAGDGIFYKYTWRAHLDNLSDFGK
jgi:hypothetical protein